MFGEIKSTGPVSVMRNKSCHSSSNPEKESRQNTDFCVLATISLLIWMYLCLDLVNLLEEVARLWVLKTLCLLVMPLATKQPQSLNYTPLYFIVGNRGLFCAKHANGAQAKIYILQPHLTTTQFLTASACLLEFSHDTFQTAFCYGGTF